MKKNIIATNKKCHICKTFIRFDRTKLEKNKKLTKIPENLVPYYKAKPICSHCFCNIANWKNGKSYSYDKLNKSPNFKI